MFIDTARAEAAGRADCGLLVVGAGPAGITLALELAAARPDLDIVLLEAGGLLPPDAEGRALYDGSSSGPSSYPLAATRLRYFGGTSGHWGGWCRPFDEVDFSGASGANPAWPLDPATLAPHYAAAHRWLEIASDDYAPESLDAATRARLLELGDDGDFRNRLFRFSPPTRFGTRYKDQVAATASIRCLLGATLLALEGDAAGLREAVVATGDGGRLRLRPRHVVLAMGGLESTRQLLLMRESGFGYAGLASPALGRGFADHSGLRPGELLLRAKLAYHRTSDPSGPVMAVIAPTPEALARHGWHNACVMLEPQGGDDGLPLAHAKHAELGYEGGEAWRYAAQLILEPSRRRQSHVALDEARDAHGRPRVRLHWDVDPADFERGAAMFSRLVDELSRRGLGRGRSWAVDPRALARQPSAASHHLGCARMAESADEGVVDAELRLHGCANLDVLSTATYPGAGYSNPTLTLVALAHRLAGRLAGELAA